ncbi:hypothetical protein ARMSODRAFT_974075 [Armillaria solidipes]|uniref:Thioester reductase (TE) domain-containing protein n=1 Tax=Armillaria solidipes TaxID=1076256 RepID=A0A2H3BV21_9AGAR|nr:hypothetical protein ARMSODRAFT_974075 [Armillaria solidipes]
MHVSQDIPVLSRSPIRLSDHASLSPMKLALYDENGDSDEEDGSSSASAKDPLVLRISVDPLDPFWGIVRMVQQVEQEAESIAIPFEAVTNALYKNRDPLVGVLLFRKKLPDPTADLNWCDWEGDITDVLESLRKKTAATIEYSKDYDQLVPKLQETYAPLPSDFTTKPITVFLTGAAGFLGGLKEGSTDRGVWDDEWVTSGRLEVLAGDLSLDNFGLEQEWNRVAEEADAILHKTALVYWVDPYEKLRAANEYPESDDFEGPRASPKTGYGQSKWAFEKLLFEAGRRGGTSTASPPNNASRRKLEQHVMEAPDLNDTNTTSVLRPHTERMNMTVDDELMGKYLVWLVRAGFLPSLGTKNPAKTPPILAEGVVKAAGRSGA